jgi:hypothetical protein
MSKNPEIRPPQTWAQRNAGNLIGAVCFGLIALVVGIQVGC